ncbi:unnamed protein product [marine sediment metagenome]|uniref:Uncharacterized protein n=1 Tax=marine sediment metagenome TaxID=412755 RepID=X1L2M8_9ZZZZ
MINVLDVRNSGELHLWLNAIIDGKTFGKSRSILRCGRLVHHFEMETGTDRLLLVIGNYLDEESILIAVDMVTRGNLLFGLLKAGVEVIDSIFTSWSMVLFLMEKYFGSGDRFLKKIQMSTMFLEKERSLTKHLDIWQNTWRKKVGPTTGWDRYYSTQMKKE